MSKRKETIEADERLLRVKTARRGDPVELRVHYAIDRAGGCDTYHLFHIEDVD